MSHSTVFVLLLVALTGIAIVHGQKCEGLKKKGWGGRCFSSPNNLLDYTAKPKCDSLLFEDSDVPPPGCKQGEACCIKCDRQTKLCNKAYGGSVSRDECCPSELQVGEPVRPGSGCICCKGCKPKPTCRRGKHRGHCITENDPKYNVKWCESHPGWKIYKTRCTGWGCWCCTWDHSA